MPGSRLHCDRRIIASIFLWIDILPVEFTWHRHNHWGYMVMKKMVSAFLKKTSIYIYIWLVVWNMSFMFPDVGNHPKWRTHIFFRGVETTNQIYILYKQGYINHKFTSRTAQSSGESFKDRTTGEVSCCDSGMAEQMDRKVVEALSCVSTMWGPPVISWFISPSNYSYTYHKP